MEGVGIFQVIGIPGAGKTTVARLTAEHLGLVFIDFADLIIQHARLLNRDINSHDDILLELSSRSLDESVTNARNDLMEKAHNNLIILETHLAPNRGTRGYSFTTPKILQERLTLGIAYITDSAKGVELKRNTRGALRDQKIGRSTIENDQLVTLISAVSSCSYLDLPFLIINNVHGQLEESVRCLSEFIGEVRSKNSNTL